MHHYNTGNSGTTARLLTGIPRRTAQHQTTPPCRRWETCALEKHRGIKKVFSSMTKHLLATMSPMKCT
ncbi:hypothetical protein ACFPFV_00110 [Salinicoccus siamensis]|uniref:hypothetical protein n=1 Tax=Salinicoccus siamensis TaxID=381830 RepID=UPI003609ED68